MLISTNGLSMEGICKGDKNNLGSFIIATFVQDSLLLKAQKTQLQTGRQNGKRARENKLTANVQVTFKNISYFGRKSRSCLVFIWRELNISNVTGYTAELEQRFLTAQSAIQSHMGVFMLHGCFPCHASPCLDFARVC